MIQFAAQAAGPPLHDDVLVHFVVAAGGGLRRSAFRSGLTGDGRAAGSSSDNRRAAATGP